MHLRSISRVSQNPVTRYGATQKNCQLRFLPKIWHDFWYGAHIKVWHWRSLNLNANTKLHTQNLELITLSVAKVSQSLDSKLHEWGDCIRLRKHKNLKTPTTKCHIEYLLSSITGSFKLTHWGSLRCHYKLLFSSKSLSEVQIWTCNLQTLQSSPIAMKAPNVISHLGEGALTTINPTLTLPPSFPKNTL